MGVYRRGRECACPEPRRAAPDGLLAVGGDLAPERLLTAYALGIFPWYEEPHPILWHCPDPRMALVPSELRVSKSLRKRLRHPPYSVHLDGAFADVIELCARTPRKDGRGTWITPAMIDAYCRLYEMGFAHSVETLCDGELVGGLYGVSLGGCFFGESMFTLRTDASKVAFVALVRQLEAWGFDLVDCQVHTDHLARFGARDRPRARFLEELGASLAKPTRRGRWSFDRCWLDAEPATP